MLWQQQGGGRKHKPALSHSSLQTGRQDLHPGEEAMGMRDSRRAQSDASHGRSISLLSWPCNSAGKHREPFTSHLPPPPPQLQTQPLSSMPGFLLAFFQALRRGGREVTFKLRHSCSRGGGSAFLKPRGSILKFSLGAGASLQEPPDKMLSDYN